MHPLYLTGIPRIIAACVLGFLFGFVLIRSKLAQRQTFIDQSRFKDNTFAITFLFSIVIGVPLFYFLSKYNFIRLDVNNYKFWGIVIGAFITGLGVSFCGHIPITAVVSFGSGKLYSLWILIGMLTAFPLMKLCKPIVNDYVFSHKAPANVNMLAKDTIFYDGKTTMLYVLPIVCLILALFLRLIQPRKK